MASGFEAEFSVVEEERFRATLKRGLDLLDTNSEWSDVGGHKTLPGATVFKLYDTFGFPVDLQEVIGREHGFGIDQAGFDEEQRQPSARHHRVHRCSPPPGRAMRRRSHLPRAMRLSLRAPRTSFSKR